MGRCLFLCLSHPHLPEQVEIDIRWHVIVHIKKFIIFITELHITFGFCNNISNREQWIDIIFSRIEWIDFDFCLLKFALIDLTNWWHILWIGMNIKLDWWFLPLALAYISSGAHWMASKSKARKNGRCKEILKAFSNGVCLFVIGFFWRLGDGCFLLFAQSFGVWAHELSIMLNLLCHILSCSEHSKMSV